MEKEKCITCGQDIYSPLLEEYKDKRKYKQLRAIATLKKAVREAYGDGEEGATLFAMGLIEKLKEEELI